MTLPPALWQIAFLLLCDAVLLTLLDVRWVSLTHLGVPDAWLEAALRLLAFWGAQWLLSLAWPPRIPLAAVATVSLLTPFYLTVGHCFGDPPVLLSSAPWSWLILGYGAVGLALFIWKVLGQGSSREAAKGKDKATLWKLVRLSLPDVSYLSGAFVFLIMAVIGETFIPYYTGYMIDILGKKYDSEDFSLAIFLVCLVSLGSSLSVGCREGLFTFAISRAVNRTRGLLFSSLVRQDMAFFQEVKIGDLTSRLSKDTAMMSKSVPFNINLFLRSLAKSVGLYGFMFGLSWRLTLLMLIETPIMLAVQKVYDARHQAVLQAIQDSLAHSGEVVRETVSSIETIRSFGSEEEESQRYDSALDETRRLKNQRDVETAVYVIIRRDLMRSYGGALSNVGAAEKVFEYLHREPSVHTGGKLTPVFLQGCVSFRNVSFCYPSRPDIQALKKVSFELYPGAVTALVGLNGSGKSTCVALLERFYEPHSGEILLDEVPIQEYEHQYLHRQVALVSQEPVLFSGSVRDNITYNMQACSMEEVTRAAEEADALGFIQNLEGGFSADVGEKGNQLSAGQKQRLAIARALIRNPKVLVLDEATSALDVESEAAIQQSLLKRRSRTVLVIAHRMQTVENAAKIVVLQGGQVVEEGTHAQLMEEKGPYYRLVQRSQAERLLE
ncbi:antigen peptide transporter 2 isoform X4 [Varanus komodoensis]|uniref:antigen peptide transporter 2 isoform X4 n=1 Tax=Varanus komodoensis TaxID=61221 RepID=UPI001CF7A2BD|nr:antigen peptide transporter 2 isoform X4 [Varanus komodoensis]